MWEKVKGWYADPFNTEMSVTGWFVFVGFLICVTIMWRIILAHIIEGLDA